jgi:NAD+ synthase (glutamine-hydrolysing)
MVKLGVGELGFVGFKERLLGEGSSVPASEAELVRQLLTTVYQATKNSSKLTESAAAALAEALGCTHIEQDIQELVDGYLFRAEQALGRPLTWAEDDLALQNIQARARAPGVWLIANVKRLLLLSTSNRSEAAVGYATMDGDTAGGLSPIAGIDKAFLLRWLVWLQNQGPLHTQALPELRVITSQSPTAELRPQAAQQTDEDDLMPYPILDAIERAYIVDRLSPTDVYRSLSGRFEGVDSAKLLLWVRRFFQLWATNQWKRERYAPSFHLDDANLDPKTWCRFPILSGGFSWELEELERFVREEETQPKKLS